MKKSNKIVLAGAGTVLAAGLIFAVANHFFYMDQGQRVLEKQKINVSVTDNQPRALTDFNRVYVGGWFDVNVQQGPANSITRVGKTPMLPLAVTLNPNRQFLGIKMPEDKGSTQTQAEKLAITAPHLRGIAVGGKVTVHAALHADRFDLMTNGESTVVLTGTVKNLYLEVFGNAVIDAKDLTADNITIQNMGASRITVNAKQSLAVRSYGKSTVYYYGSPAQVTKTGFGEVIVQRATLARHVQ